MTRFLKLVLSPTGVLVLAAALPLGAQEGAVPPPPKGIALSGSVKKAGPVDAAALAALPRHVVPAKVQGAKAYRGTFEVNGVALKDLLEKAEVAKATPDGFDRPLDLAVVVTGRDGRKVLFSWGELFLGDDAGAALLVDRIRPLVPHHHEAIDDSRFAPGNLLGVEARETKKKDLAEPWVEAPALVLPDGKSVPLTADALKGIARVEGEDDAIGLGRGFRSHSRWAGASLAALLRAKLPAGTDSGLLFVVVTGSDGYRSLYSGGEVLLSRLPENVVLVDTEDGKPLLKKSGRLKSLPRGDFFADRDVRTVSEVRVLLAR